MPWWSGLLLSFLTTLAYCSLFNVPIRVLLPGGVIGGVGWFSYFLLQKYGLSLMMTTFLATTVVALLSQLLSIYLRVPSTNFSVAGIIPLVPGSVAYKSMLALVSGDYIGSITLATKTSLIAGAIASGLILGISIFSLWKGIVAKYAGSRAKNN